MKSSARRLAALLTCAAIAPATAQVTIPQEYGKTVKTAEAIGTLGTDLFGDQTNFYTGSTTFSATDISLPGNSALPVAVGRRLVVGSREPLVAAGDGMFVDWDLDIPHLRGVFSAGVFSVEGGWQIDNFSPMQGWGDPNQRCSGNGLREAVTSTGSFSGIWYGPEYWQGYTMYVPGVGDQDMLVLNSGTNPHKPTDGNTYKWVTNQQWYVSCLPQTANGYPGEGFLAIAPDGTRYWFDHFAERPASTIVKERGPTEAATASGTADADESGMTTFAPVGDKTSLSRVEVWALPTRVEDRFGNSVTYTYDASHPWRLTTIAANDGRALSLTYNTQGHIASVSDGSRTWTYVYGSGLTEVRLPDQSKWILAIGTLRSAQTEPETNSNVTQYCQRAGSSASQPIYTGTITHPSGAVGTFRFQSKVHGRSYVTKQCVLTNPPNLADYARYPYLFDAISLLSKSISGPGLPAGMTWTYAYGATNQSWAENCPNDSCIASKTVAVTGPDHFTRYTFSNRWQHSEGKLLKVETGPSSSSILRTETTDYLTDPAGQAFPAMIGRTPFARGDRTAQKYTPAIKRTIAQQGATFTWQVNQTAGVYAFDEFAHVEAVTKDSSLVATKTETTEYFNDLSLWVLGQVERTTTNGIETARTEFGWMALPSKTYVFNKLQNTFTYDAASALSTGLRGTLKTVSDGRDGTIDTTTTFTEWKRGIPGRITYPIDGYQKAVIGNAGWITSITNEAGFTTTYGYDPMGRLASINYPDETSPAPTYNNTTLAFAPSATAAYGLPAGHWKQTVTTGRGRTDIHFDALWRPIVKATYDLDEVAATLSQAVTRYDAGGHPSFTSYPQRSQNTTITNTWGNPAVAPNALGVDSEYDALGRVTRTLADSELGALETTTEYLVGFQTRVTNPKLQQTTTSYLAWDQPVTDFPVAIDHPEGARTTIGRDPFGKPTFLRRHNDADTYGLTRTYTYNGYQELCRTVEPETGATLMGYDAAGNLAWSASGLPAGTACDLEGDTAAIMARRAVRQYDERNRVTALSFPDGQSDTTYTYTPDGLLESLTALNGGTNTVASTYEYNNRRLLTRETMSWNSDFSWPVVYNYNANGHLDSEVQVNLGVSYAPNGLGQPTRAGSYATDVTYHPNGGIQQFTYGNGIVHTLTQNARQLPDRSLDAYGTTKYLDDGYDYDGNANVAAITDGATGQNQRGNRTMTYDGLDRLKTTVSSMYGLMNAHYSYDELDNLTRVKIGGTKVRDHWYCYDLAGQLTNVKTVSCSGTSVIGLGYDAQGNLDNRNGDLYTFDMANRLRTFDPAASGASSTYVYDGHGRRVRDLTGAARYSLYSQSGQLKFGQDNRSRIQSWYVSLGGSLVATRERNIDTGVLTYKYNHTDALGSPVVVTDANRNVLERSEYEPYGQVLNRPVADGPGYTGHVMDAASGLVYMQQRYYDPSIGRFLSVDPVTADGATGANFNRYWYANNNPYRFTDPDGRLPDQRGGSHPQEDQQERERILRERQEEIRRIRQQELRAKSDRFAGGSGRVLPSTSALRKAYPGFGKNPAAHPSSNPAYINQCAIRMSVALIGSNFPLTGFNGATTEEGWARGAQELANYLAGQVGQPLRVDYEDFRNASAPVNYTNFEGVIFEPRVPHIDVVDHGYAGSRIWGTTGEVWLWPTD